MSNDESCNLGPTQIGVECEEQEVKPGVGETLKGGGNAFNVDKENGLNGFCDYIISGSSEQFYLEAPIITIVEAKNENINSGMGQCIAEMYAAKIFNDAENQSLSRIYGAITTGDEWKFLKLMENIAYIERQSYYISEINKVVGILINMAEQKA